MIKSKVILDSGAYTAFKKGKVIDMDKYAQYVVEHGKEYAGCFNLDSIGNAKDEQRAKSKEETTTAEQSYKNWKYLRDKGADTIPVFHIGTDEKWLQRYLKQTDYIGLGAIANLDTTQRMLSLSRIWKEYLTDDKGMPKVKVHGLGLTAIDIMIRYPWASVDSFTPVISAIWGSILLPKLDNDGTPHYFGLSIYKVSDQGDHKEGMANSFPNLPERNKEFYMELFEEHNFKLGEIAYQPRKDRRGKKGEQERKPKPLFDLIKPSDPDIKTLANSWEVRMHWNLVMWNHLRDRLPIYPRPFEDKERAYEEEVNTHEKTIMYMGVSTTTQLQIFEKVKPKLDILISYAYLSDSISKLIKNYIK